MPYKDKELKRLKDREYRQRNKERCSEQNRLWREKNRERVNANARAWRAKNREKVKDVAHRKYIRRREELAEYGREYRAANRERYQAHNRINNRIQSKKWPRASFFMCCDCSDRAVDYHHEDYSQWWSVEPLCRSCHKKRHQGN